MYKMNLLNTLLLFLSVCVACPFVAAQQNSSQLLNELLKIIDINNNFFQLVLDNNKVTEAFKIPFNNAHYRTISHYFLRKDYSLFPENEEDLVKELKIHIRREKAINLYYRKYDDHKNTGANDKTLSYDQVTNERKRLMRNIFINFFRNDLKHQDMCSEDNPVGDMKCKFVALIRSTREEVLDFVYSPWCRGNKCLFDPYYDAPYENNQTVGGNDPGEYREMRVPDENDGKKDSYIIMKYPTNILMEEILEW